MPIFSIRGNSLVEYILPVAIVCVMALVTLFSFQPSMLTALLGQLGSNPARLQDKQAGLKKMGANPALNTVVFTLEDGTQLSLSNYPADLALAIETEGVNGTTELLIANLRDVSKQLLEAGKITPEEYANFEAMANQGHQLAQLQKILVNSTLSGDRDLYTQKYTIDGERYGLIEIADLISDSGSPAEKILSTWAGKLFEKTADKGILASKQNLTGKQLNKFNKLYVEATKSPAMNDPALKKVIASLSLDIRNISNVSAWQSSQVLQDLFPLKRYESSLADRITHSKSYQICTNGGPNATDTGTQCYNN